MKRVLLSASVSTELFLAMAVAEPATIPAESSLSEPPTTRYAPTTEGARRMEADHALGISTFWENDGNFAKPNWPTDKHYTAGVGADIQWQTLWTNDLVSSLPSINSEFDRTTPGTSYAAGVELALNIYTPKDITDPDPIYNDRPYAGWTYAGFMLQRANRAADVPVQEHFELDIGTIGPTGQAGAAQQWIHETFGYTYPEGWDNQVREEIGADFRYQRHWRIDLLRWDDQRQFAVQMIPEAGVTVGTMHDNVNAGVTLRAGWHMPDDFGPNRLHSPVDFTRPMSRETSSDRPAGFFHSLGGYAFVRPSGRLVAHDSTMDGSFFRGSPVTVNSEAAVAEIQVGFAIQFLEHWEFSYSQTYTSPEFSGQKQWDSFGALTLSYVLAW